jgi:hypothetical protein
MSPVLRFTWVPPESEVENLKQIYGLEMHLIAQLVAPENMKT